MSVLPPTPHAATSQNVSLISIPLPSPTLENETNRKRAALFAFPNGPRGQRLLDVIHVDGMSLLGTK